MVSGPSGQIGQSAHLAVTTDIEAELVSVRPATASEIPRRRRAVLLKTAPVNITIHL